MTAGSRAITGFADAIGDLTKQPTRVFVARRNPRRCRPDHRMKLIVVGVIVSVHRSVPVIRRKCLYIDRSLNKRALRYLRDAQARDAIP